MANEPNDDVFRNLAKAMEEMIRNLPGDEPPRFIGCTIISGSGDDGHIFHMDDFEDDLDYDLVEDSGFFTSLWSYPAKNPLHPVWNFGIRKYG